MSKRFTIVQNSLKTVYLFRYSYIKELVKLGKVTVIAPIDDVHAKNELLSLGVNIAPIPHFEVLIGRLISYFLMNAFVLKERLLGAVIVCHFIVTLLMCFFSLVPFNDKLLVSIEGLGSLFSHPSKIRRALAFLLRQSSARVIFCNHDERKAIGRESDVVAGGIGVDLERFPSKESVELKDGKYHLLYVGRLIKDKGVFDAIEVLRRLKQANVPVVLDLVGDIYPNNPTSLSDSDIKQLETEFGNSINFLGFTHSVQHWYIDDHILLLPSKREGFPVCVMEASASGIPVVGYSVPGMSDAISPKVNGLLANYGDVDELTKLTKSLLSLETLEQYRVSSSLFALRHFSRQRKSENMIELIRKLCNE